MQQKKGIIGVKPNFCISPEIQIVCLPLRICFCFSSSECMALVYDERSLCYLLKFTSTVNESRLVDRTDTVLMLKGTNTVLQT